MLSISLSASYHVYSDPEREELSQDGLNLESCQLALAQRHQLLRESAAEILGGTEPSKQRLEHWQGFRKAWKRELHRISARCHLRQNRERKALRVRAEDLERLELAYTTALKGFLELGRKPIKRLYPEPTVP